MGKVERMGKTTARMVATRRCGELLKAEFKEKFGHSFDRFGYHGHPFYGYHCYGCGIHISRITNKGLQEQLALDMAKGKNGTQG